MATCKECSHVEVCKAIVTIINEATELQIDDDTETTIDADLTCEYFADRSRFVELSHAEWVEDEDMYGDPIYRCSNCNEHFVLEEGTPTDNCYSYCPNCGAKMDEQALKEREENE